MSPAPCRGLIAKSAVEGREGEGTVRRIARRPGGEGSIEQHAICHCAFASCDPLGDCCASFWRHVSAGADAGHHDALVHGRSHARLLLSLPIARLHDIIFVMIVPIWPA